MNDALGDRMKMYEQDFLVQRFMPLLPIVARIDGRGFSKFTKGMKRPYDERMQQCMIATTDWLVRHTGASMGYTQSDEITLVWYTDNLKRKNWFDGRVYKMISQLAAQATDEFSRQCMEIMPQYWKRRPTFDARAYNVPNKQEAANVFLWREWDATKNSIQMAGHHYFGHKRIHKSHGGQIKDMLINEAGVNWNNYPPAFKRGTYIQRQILETPFSPQEIASLPPQHNYFKEPNLIVKRSFIHQVDMPPLTRVANRIEVIFDGAEPRTAEVADLPPEVLELEASI